ncbi:hypothetical protein ACFVTX_00365 [Agromyces sp. NPDC058136]|uniref:hypothetical protein n=1 Tax=Agromyces sp. NPDC058136 TaxID=3346354 RepID=UPI0036D76AA8
MARLPVVLGTHDLPLAELCAARIDGELFAIDEGWAPVDEPDLPSFRAAVVALRMPRRLIIERLSAAWVHGALDAPPRTAQFCVPLHERIAVAPALGTIVREVVVSDAELVELAGVRCTSVPRTAFDLLRDQTLDDATAERVVARLLGQRPALDEEVSVLFAAARRMPRITLARARFARASDVAVSSGPIGGQPSLTR